MQPDFINPMVLAYLGDAVFEVLVRQYLIVERNIVKPNDLQKEAIRYVSAVSHFQFMKEALKQNWLEEKEIDIYKRGRNTKNTKTETNEHRHSTGFEAIIGTLYLQQNQKRIEEIFELYKEFILKQK